MTQFSMDPIAKLGLLKMDFLGLTNLSILDRAIGIIKEHTGEHVDLGSVPFDDAKTFALLSSGETTGLFQLEGAGMRRYIKDLKPSSLLDGCRHDSALPAGTHGSYRCVHPVETRPAGG